MSEGQWLHHMIQKNRSDLAHTPVTVWLQPQPVPTESPKDQQDAATAAASKNQMIWFAAAAVALYIIYGRK